MKQYVGLDVSLEQTSICVVNSAGKILWQGKTLSTPEAIAAAIRARAPGAERIGFESGPLSAWLWHELKKLGLPVVCLDARHPRPHCRYNSTNLTGTTRWGWHRLCALAGIARS
jgi:transposase